MPQMGAPSEPQLPMEVQIASELADIEDKRASAEHKRAQAYKATQEADLAPMKMAYERQMAIANLAQNAQDKAEDRKVAARQQNRQPAR